MRRWGVGAAVLVLLAGAIAWVAPWLTRARDIPASVPSPQALERIDMIVIAPGHSTCAPYVTMETHSARARFTMITNGRRPQPATLTLTGPGYRASGRVPATYGDLSRVQVPVPVPRHALLARACLRNDGTHRIDLAATSDRARSRSIATVDGHGTGKSPWLSFGEAKRHSILDRLPVTLQRMSTFRPGVVGPWLLWPLALLVLLGVPAGVVWAYGRSLAEETVEPRGERPAPDVRDRVPG